MTNEEILNELKNISAETNVLCERVFNSTTSELGLSELRELAKIGIKVDELCEHVFDLTIAILGNWHKVADDDLPNKSDGKQIYLCQIASNKGILKDPLLCCYYGGFVNHITLEPMAYDDNVIAWMELPKYNNEQL